ncbi:hypothetical protein [Beijerinckia sp. L45]|uniref:hypothetical protein n=1 Tax=Beijerinckia sp. L45 TaxID=1641855 RepID=UPI00131DEDB9|nr:hypothetical protein [Beijerinckia sp. L45]
MPTYCLCRSILSRKKGTGFGVGDQIALSTPRLELHCSHNYPDNEIASLHDSPFVAISANKEFVIGRWQSIIVRHDIEDRWVVVALVPTQALELGPHPLSPLRLLIIAPLAGEDNSFEHSVSSNRGSGDHISVR